MTLRKDLELRISKLLGGNLITHEPTQGGYTPALRLVCQTRQGTAFVKIGIDELTSSNLRREIKIYRQLQAPFMPNLIAYDDSDIEPILILEDLSACHWLPPWDERRVTSVLEQIHHMHSTPIEAEPFQSVIGHKQLGWHTVSSNPEPFLSLGLVDPTWLDKALPILMEAESRCTTEGSSLCHWDLRSDNMCLKNQQALFIDWNHACLSNPVLDIGFWLPSLASEGGPQPESILPDAPDVAAWVSGFFASRAGLPVIPNAPRVRWVQQEQLKTALPWVTRALDLPPLDGFNYTLQGM